MTTAPESLRYAASDETAGPLITGRQLVRSLSWGFALASVTLCGVVTLAVLDARMQDTVLARLITW